MCGIHCSISTGAIHAPSPALSTLLCQRGPDHTGQCQSQVVVGSGSNASGEKHVFSLSFTSTVLALRGGQITCQPFQDHVHGSVLCWNGEAWSVDNQPVEGNDGQVLFSLLVSASNASHTAGDAAAAILAVVKSLAGPFAFIFFDKAHNQVFFGRDCLGRRSLLYNIDERSAYMEFASVADPTRGNWKEVEADAIYMLSLDEAVPSRGSNDSGSLQSESILPLSKHLWTQNGSNLIAQEGSAAQVPMIGIFNRVIPSTSDLLRVDSPSVGMLRSKLQDSLKLRVLNVLVPPGSENTSKVRVGVLFSGGLDCTVLARMVHDILPPDQEIDLLNVAFENPRVVQAALNPRKPKSKVSRVVANSHTLDQPPGQVVSDPCLDFYSPFESCPDRETGRRSFQELQSVCHGRTWRFVAVDVPYPETQAHKAQVIQLISPHNTEMDLSIAHALYFASRGIGQALTSGDPIAVPYTSPARIVLSGLGADELFGGYTRHATAFERRGYLGLIDELELDVTRLGKRNLGRDDRVISNWGREARFPFLDESLVKWAVEAPIWEKCGFTSDHIVSSADAKADVEPGKKVLRLLADELGMHLVAREKKRAIQFGARTAKMETGRTKGTTLIS
ncbi:asparagine synthase [Phlyctema vagabunda]|uniref:Asparagine synthase n=1 Tax=Phlyctema vagabunda TaxID=108571 RepID=A0ABR4PBL4_9HELO